MRQAWACSWPEAITGNLEEVHAKTKASLKLAPRHLKGFHLNEGQQGMCTAACGSTDYSHEGLNFSTAF